MSTQIAIAALAVCLGAAAPALATEAAPAPAPAGPDLEAGAALYKKECRGCHGPTAKGLASYPKLAGHPRDYLVTRLEQYRAGERLGPNTPLMAPRARNLSDADIANVVGFIVETTE